MFVKICGTTSEDDALLAVALGADAVGFVFAPSPRQIAPQLAADIVKRLPREILTVGVFRDQAPKLVVETVHSAGLHAAQLHGHESVEDVRWVRERVPKVIRAYAAGDARARSVFSAGADWLLLDSPNPGSGQIFDWELLAEVPAGIPFLIAGGLNASNVAAAIERARPFGVDAVSGVERSPGRKDPVKLREFIAAAKAAEPVAYQPGATAPYDWEEDR